MRVRVLNSLISIVLLATNLDAAETNVCSTYRVVDLNAGSVGSFPSNMTSFGGSMLFSAYTLQAGRELWRYDGTQVTLATNINETADDIGFGVLEGNDSAPVWLTPFSESLYFSAFDPRRGGELWRWDGTNAFRAADINPDLNDTIKPLPNNSYPTELTVMGDALFFSADNGAQRPNYELRRLSGGSLNLVTNIHPDSSSNYSSYPKGLKVFDNNVYFMADDGSHGFELWKCNGTNATLFDLNPGGSSSSSYPKNFTAFGGHLYFQAYQDSTGFELWCTDGSTVSLVTNLNASGGSSFPEFLTVYRNALFFSADDGAHGNELWKYDGTNAVLVADLNVFGDAYPKHLTVFKDQLCFAATDALNGWELWTCDGAAVSLVTNLNMSGDSFPESLTLFHDGLYFVATTPATGYELWNYNGQTVAQISEINPDAGNAYPQFLHAFGNQLLFSATEDGSSNWELWSHTVAPLRITGATLSGEYLTLTWQSLGGTTNVIQAADAIDGFFQDYSEPVILPGTGVSSTNVVVPFNPEPPGKFFRVISR